MSNAVTKRGLLAMASRILLTAAAFAVVGLVIGSAGMKISRPGVVAWTSVLTVFGCIIGSLGGRFSHVVLGAAGFALVSAVAGMATPGVSSAELAVSALLPGAIGGGLLRPWFSLAAGICRMAYSVIRVAWPRTAVPDVGRAVQAPHYTRRYPASVAEQ